MSPDLTIRPLADTARSVETALEARAGRVRNEPDAAQKFESFVLQTFIQEMLPKNAEGVFGSGIAGDFWRSMMAEKMAEQVAERGDLGIADLVRAGGAVPTRNPASISLNVLNHLSTLDAAAFEPPHDEPKSGA